MLSNRLISLQVMCIVAVAALARMSEPAHAIPTIIDFSLWTHNAPGDPTQIGLIQGDHIFGTQGQVMSGGPPPHSVVVSSNPSLRPGWQYELSVNYAGFNTSFLAPVVTLELGIKPPGTPLPITEFFVKTATGAPFPILPTSGIINGGGTIHIDADAQQLIQHFPGPIIIQWNQAPTPGALALLGLAGVLSGGRRRQSKN